MTRDETKRRAVQAIRQIVSAAKELTALDVDFKPPAAKRRRQRRRKAEEVRR